MNALGLTSCVVNTRSGRYHVYDSQPTADEGAVAAKSASAPPATLSPAPTNSISSMPTVGVTVPPSTSPSSLTSPSLSSSSASLSSSASSSPSSPSPSPSSSSPSSPSSSSLPSPCPAPSPQMPSPTSGGDDVPLLVLHGMFTTGSSMGPLAVLLAAHRRVLVPDMLDFDFGWSVSNAGRRHVSWTGSIDPVIELIQELIARSGGRFRQVDVLGHSYGSVRCEMCVFRTGCLHHGVAGSCGPLPAGVCVGVCRRLAGCAPVPSCAVTDSERGAGGTWRTGSLPHTVQGEDARQ